MRTPSFSSALWRVRSLAALLCSLVLSLVASLVASPVVSLAAAALVASGCGDDSPPAEEPPPVPRLEEVACRFELGAYQAAGLAATCGDLVVWEDRATRARPIALHFARFAAAAASGRPPIVLLNGGPGEDVQTLLGRLSPAAVTAVTAAADLVVFDQRGVGQSTPRLSCPLPFDRQRPVEALSADKRAALAACLASYAAAGIHVAAYDSRASADDVAELGGALGYAQLDLIGLSYGSWLALEVLRRHPAAVRAMVLDAVAPPHLPYFLRYGSYLDDSLRKLAEKCAQDAGCALAYPDLYPRFLAAVADLDAAPLALPGLGTSLDGGWLVEDVYASLRVASRHRDLPLLLDAAARRDAARVAAFYAKYPSLLQGDSDGADANGMNRAVTCNDRWRHVTDEKVAAALAPVPAPLAARIKRYDFDYNRAACAAWPLAAPDENAGQPVRSPAPVLLLAGELDPRSPPALASLTAQELPGAFVRTVTSGGHGVSGDRCALAWILRFLSDPSAPPQGACGAPIRFTLP